MEPYAWDYVVADLGLDGVVLEIILAGISESSQGPLSPCAWSPCTSTSFRVHGSLIDSPQRSLDIGNHWQLGAGGSL